MIGSTMSHPKRAAASAGANEQDVGRVTQDDRYKKLSRSAQIDFEIWQHELKKQHLARGATPSRFANDPRVYNELHHRKRLPAC